MKETKQITFKPKRCKICGELFTPTSRAQTICNKNHYAKCPVCGKLVLWNHTYAVSPCSKECSRILRQRHNLEKYGVTHPMQLQSVREKQQATMIEKYGVSSPLQSEEIRQRAIRTNQEKFGCDWALSDKDVKEQAVQTMEKKYGAKTTLQSSILASKMQATMFNKYGVDNAMKSQVIQSKEQATMQERYGVSFPIQDEEIKQHIISKRKEHSEQIAQQIKETTQSRYGVDNVSKLPETIDKIQQTMIQRYGVKAAMQLPEFKEHWRESLKQNHPEGLKISQPNLELKAKLESFGFAVELEKKVESKYYDLYLPQENLLIEIDKTITHNSAINIWKDEPCDAGYQLLKTEIAERNGYRCIHIFDWDNIDKIIASLLHKHKIYARKCVVTVISTKTANNFISKYHLQGKVQGQKICIGLYYQMQLVEVMTFGKSRYNKKYDWELLRLCTKSGYTVIGGASKLFKYALKQYEIDNIISYCDRAKFSGKVYYNLGMKLDHISSPNKIWSKDNRYITANMLRAQGYDRLFNTSYGKGTNNEDLMLLHDWLPVYDCGQYVFTYKRVAAE